MDSAGNMKNDIGQAQLLTASMIGIVMLSGGLYLLDQSSRTTTEQVRQIKRSEIRAALRTAVKRASAIYHEEASCDAVIFEKKLDRIQLDGSIGVTKTEGARQIDVTINGTPYRVAFGEVTRANWEAASDPTITGNVYTAGTSQDVLLEIWTSTVSRMKLRQRALLINNCTTPSNVNRAIAYHTISQPANFSQGTSGAVVPDVAIWGGARTCIAGKFIGDIDGNGSVDPNDLILLKNYLRSRDRSGIAATTFIGDGTNWGCADINSDKIVDETDLNGLEKALRGYSYWIPSHY